MMSQNATRDSSPTSLRSARWLDISGRKGFSRRAYLNAEGFPPGAAQGRPVIGIANSWSELNPCNSHLRDLAEVVKRGVWEAGGLPLEFPTISLGEPYMLPTTMLFRNLMSMDVEECIRANPIDGVVLLAGCDKTTPAQLMGAASVGLPTIMMTGGPMLKGKFRGQDVGSGTHPRKFLNEVRAGRMSLEEFEPLETCLARSNGHCMTMGTASTMALTAEALGMQLPGSASLSAVDSRRKHAAHAVGRRIVAMVEEDLSIGKILTREAFENAIRVNAAIGGSTNAAIHLLAIAGRAGVELKLDDFDRLTTTVPLLANLLPSGAYLMEDFDDAGGLPPLMDRIADQLHLSCLTVTGETVGENIGGAECFNDDVIRLPSNPISVGGSTAVLRGNLCPDGAVIKQSAASPELLKTSGKAIVFDSIEDCERSIDDPDLDVDATSVLIVRNCGPRGYPGMPEVGNLPIPRRLLEQGIRDIVRISDARMSGTAFGTIVLHVAPEAAAGGPLALVRTGDTIELDVEARTLNIAISDEELGERRATYVPPAPVADRGYSQLYIRHVMQADTGADLDFLVGSSGDAVPHQTAGHVGS